jgi:hypothetical protein
LYGIVCPFKIYTLPFEYSAVNMNSHCTKPTAGYGGSQLNTARSINELYRGLGGGARKEFGSTLSTGQGN